jgi:hypothetical protein
MSLLKEFQGERKRKERAWHTIFLQDPLKIDEEAGVRYFSFSQDQVSQEAVQDGLLREDASSCASLKNEALLWKVEAQL